MFWEFIKYRNKQHWTLYAFVYVNRYNICECMDSNRIPCRLISTTFFFVSRIYLNTLNWLYRLNVPCLFNINSKMTTHTHTHTRTRSSSPLVGIVCCESRSNLKHQRKTLNGMIVMATGDGQSSANRFTNLSQLPRFPNIGVYWTNCIIAGFQVAVNET